MLAQELQNPMEFDHPPILVRGLSAQEIVHKIAFKDRRKFRRELYGIGITPEICFRKPDSGKVVQKKVDKESLPFFETKKTIHLSDFVDDF